MASTTASAGSTREDRELARLALAGDGGAFAELYDRHERRVYGFCLRMLSREDDAAEAAQETFVRLLRRLPALEGREVNFVAYALSTARNACYDVIKARRRVEPVGEPIEPTGSEPGALELDPERAALLAATRETVRLAHARLSDRQREALALRELEQLSYEEIGAVVELNANGVAQLISRARIRLRDLLSGSELASIAGSSPECERALPLLAKLQDDELGEGEELTWVRAHLGDCETCRSRRAAMQEAGVSYRALGPIVVLTWLRHATIARAAELVGADWSHLTERHGSTGSDAGERSRGGGDGEPDDLPGGAPAGSRRLRRRLIALALACALLALVLSTSLARDAHVRDLNVQPRAPAVPPPKDDPHTPAFAALHRRRAGSRIESGSGAPTLVGVTPGSAAAAPGQPSTSTQQTPTANHHANRRHVPSHPSPAASPPSPISTPTTTTPTTTTPAPPSTETTASTPTTTTTGTTSMPTNPGAPGGPPASGGGHECPPTAFAC